MFDELFPILTVSDMSRALGFYRDLLGAEVGYQFPPEGEPGYVGLNLGRSHFGLGAGEVTDKSTLWVYTDDCDAAVTSLAAAGVVVAEPPADQPWGERMATVLDPDGHRVIVASR